MRLSTSQLAVIWHKSDKSVWVPFKRTLYSLHIFPIFIEKIDSRHVNNDWNLRVTINAFCSASSIKWPMSHKQGLSKFHSKFIIPEIAERYTRCFKRTKQVSSAEKSTDWRDDGMMEKGDPWTSKERRCNEKLRASTHHRLVWYIMEIKGSCIASIQTTSQYYIMWN